MKKILTRIFSVMLALATTVSVTAAPVTAKKLKAQEGSKPSITELAKPAPVKAPSKKGPRLIMEKQRSARNVAAKAFRSAARSAKVPVKAPYKTAAMYEGTVPTLWGSVTFADGWSSDYAPVGLYSVPSNANQDFDQVVLGPDGNYGGVLLDGVYYSCQVETFWGMLMGVHYTGVDVTTGEQVFNGDLSYYTLSMTLDPTSNEVYAIMAIENNYSLVKLAFEGSEPVVTEVGTLAVETTSDAFSFNSIACDANGQLYAIVRELTLAGEEYQTNNSFLAKVSKTDASMTKVGDTGELPVYMTDATIDPKTNKMYWTVCPSDETGWLCEVNLATGAATRLYQFPLNNEVAGLVVPKPAAEEGAPAAVTGAAAVFDGGSLSGVINFAAPTTTFDGAAATGDLTYTVKTNGEVVATGSTTYGAAVSAPVTVAAAGLYTFEIRVANSVGQSPAVKISNIYVGHDTPEATSATLVYENGNMNLTWLPVTASINGGYMDPAAVRYTVTRMPAGVKVAEDIAVTSFSEAIPEPAEITQYYYTVVAKCNGLSSAEAVSNTVTLGAIVPPYTANFAGDGLNGYTVIDANGDGKKWMVDGTGVKIAYNSSVAMDDWLITPPLKLEGGKLYDIEAALSANSSRFPEKVEIKFGKQATAEAMTTTLLEPTVLENGKDDPMNWKYQLVPEADGTYYIGIHGISDPDQFYLWLHSLSIGAPRSADSPAAATDLTVVPGEFGALTAKVSFKTPDKALNGNAITSLTKAELRRGETLIKTWENPAVGAELSFDDTLTEGGTYTYTVVCYNEAGVGAEVSASAFVGTDLPAAITVVHAVETANPGEVTISWDAVTTDVNGNALQPSQVKYQIFTFEGNNRVALTEPMSETSYTYQAVPAGQQDFLQYAVFAITDAGEGEGQVSEFFPAGTPYAGMTFSSDADFEQYILGVSSAGQGQWGTYTDSSFEGITSADGDNFFFGMNARYLDYYGELFTGLITLEGMVNPGFSFYSYNIELEDNTPDTNEISVAVKEKGQAEWTVIKTVVVNEVCGLNEWGKVNVSLAAYAGKVIEVSLTATTKAAAYTFVDQLKVGSMLGQDLKLASLSAPAKVATGAEYNVTAKVANDGMQASTAYSVELYSGSELLATKEGAALESGATASFDFALTMPALATEPVTYFAKVVYAADENEANNQSDNVTVEPIVPKYPVVSDLAGAAQDGAVKLTWTEPDLTAAPAEPVTQDFEDADAFAATYGDWTFVDVDQSPVGGFQGTDVPGITPGTTVGSFWIWDQTMLGNQTFQAHSGTKYLFSLFRYDDGQADDWAISPALDGMSQTISFYAKSYSSTYPEKIEVYYSTGSTTPSDFVKVEGVGGVVPGDWTLYEAELPEGAKHFAIRSCASSSFMLMVDDVTFVPEGATANLELKGYNIYRDGVKINEAPVEETEFVDANVEAGKTYSYQVTVVYSKGESAGSNAVSVLAEASGIDSAFATGLQIRVVNRDIVISGAAGQNVAVYTVDGRTIFAGKGEAKTVVAAQQGVYVVKAGKTVKKVLVK